MYTISCRALGSIRGKQRPDEISVVFTKEIIDSIFKNEITLERFHKWLKLGVYNCFTTK